MYTITVAVLALLVSSQWSTSTLTCPIENSKLSAKSELQLINNDRLVNHVCQMENRLSWNITLVFVNYGNYHDFIEKGTCMYISPQGKNVLVSYSAGKQGIYHYDMVELIDDPRA